jgi:hypothetical protein
MLDTDGHGRALGDSATTSWLVPGLPATEGPLNSDNTALAIPAIQLARSASLHVGCGMTQPGDARHKSAATPWTASASGSSAVTARCVPG